MITENIIREIDNRFSMKVNRENVSRFIKRTTICQFVSVSRVKKLHFAQLPQSIKALEEEISKDKKVE